MPCPDSDRALTAPVSRSASTSQPTWPAWSALPQTCEGVATVATTPRPNRCHRPTTPTGGASCSGRSLSGCPPHR
eukprot:2632435-Alexandrium_andersonii.AAC.1